MEGNRDEANRCIELAQRCILEKNKAEAEKYLKKAESLYPTQKAKDLLNQTKKLKWESSSAPSLREKNMSEPLKRKNRLPKLDTRVMDRSIERIMEEAIDRIISSRNYYEMLQVKRYSSDREIKKAFKKLALLIHPDKNKLPGSEEAFKLIRKAVATLTDPVQRKEYDRYDLVRSRYKRNRGDYESYYETVDRSGSSTDCSDYESTTLDDESISDHDLRYSRSYNPRPYDIGPIISEESFIKDEPTLYRIMLQILPIFLAIILWYFSSLMIPDPAYKLEPTSVYSMERFTQRLKIPYYVKSDFLKKESGFTEKNLEILEQGIENEIVRELQYACYGEKNYRKLIYQKAKNSHNIFLLCKALRTDRKSVV